MKKAKRTLLDGNWSTNVGQYNSDLQRRASDASVWMGRHGDFDSFEQLLASVRDDWMCHVVVISRDVMMVPHFSCIMGGLITAPVEISMPRGRRGIVPHRFGTDVNGG